MAEIDKRKVIEDAEAIPLETWKRIVADGNIIYSTGLYSIFVYWLYDINHGIIGLMSTIFSPYYSLLYNGSVVVDGEEWWTVFCNPARKLFWRLKRFHDKQQ